MPQQYDNTNRGVLFINGRKSKDNHPDYTGKIDIDGKERWLSAWVKTSKDGKKFLSLSLGNPVEYEEVAAATELPESTKPNGSGEKVERTADFDEDIPF